MSEGYSTKLQERVFVHSDTEAADFEIAFSATIATIVLAFPSAGNSIARYTRALAILLLIITLVRRMVVIDDYSNEERTLRATSTGVEAITILTVTYIISRATEFGPEGLAIVVLGLVPILLIIFQEVLFKNFLIYFAAWSYDVYLKDNILKEPAEAFTEHALSLSRADIPDRLVELQYFKKYKQHTNGSPANQILSRFTLVIGVGFYGLVLYILTLLFSDIILTSILLFYIIYIKLIVQFWYAAYGLPSYSELEPSAFERFLQTIAYGIVVYFVFQL